MTPRGRDRLALATIVGACFLVSALGGLLTASSVDDWYQELTKPPFNPPDAVFGPVWTLLYLMMAVAAWRVWRRPDSPERRQALALFGVQLVLNLSWSALFFGLKAVGAALVEIALLLLAILMTAAAFARIDRAAAWLMVPYAGWVAFAMVLNAAIWWLN